MNEPMTRVSKLLLLMGKRKGLGVQVEVRVGKESKQCRRTVQTVCRQCSGVRVSVREGDGKKRRVMSGAAA